MNILRAINILEKAKKHFFETKRHGNTREEYVNSQIKAIDKIIEFTNIMVKHFSEETLEKIIQDESVNIDLLRELNEEEIYYENNMENKDIENRENKNYETLYSKNIILRVNHKLVYSTVLYSGKKYIILEPKKYLKDIAKWVNWSNFKFLSEIIEANKRIINDEN